MVVEAHFDGGAIAAIPAVEGSGRAAWSSASRRYQALALTVAPPTSKRSPPSPASTR